jgi:hypothetical protein
LIDSGVRAGVVELRTAESREDEALPQHTACTNRTQKEVRGRNHTDTEQKSAMKSKERGEGRRSR